jgi:hypothetical protein
MNVSSSTNIWVELRMASFRIGPSLHQTHRVLLPPPDRPRRQEGWKSGALSLLVASFLVGAGAATLGHALEHGAVSTPVAAPR